MGCFLVARKKGECGFADGGIDLDVLGHVRGGPARQALITTAI
jgi:hypothetical protein